METTRAIELRDELVGELKARRSVGEPLRTTLEALRRDHERSVAQAVALELGVAYRELADVASTVAGLLPYELAIEATAIPLAVEDDHLVIAVLDPSDRSLMSRISSATRFVLIPVAAARMDIERMIARSRVAGHFAGSAPVEAPPPLPSGSSCEGERLVDTLLRHAAPRGEIHVESQRSGGRVRLRRMGELVDHLSLTRHQLAAVLDRIRTMCQLIHPRTMPGWGEVKLELGAQVLNCAITTLPVVWGENAMIRVRAEEPTRALADLGLTPDQRTRFEEALAGRGVVILAARNQSGLTTTIRSALVSLDAERRSIVSVEEELAGPLPGIAQVRMNTDSGLDQGGAIRAARMSRADVIAASLRDYNAKQAACGSGLGGALILGTLPAPSAADALVRLVYYGIPRFNVGHSVRLVQAQSLVRLLCAACKQPAADGVHFAARGCNACDLTGYAGRTAVFEQLPMTLELIDILQNKEFDRDVHAYVERQGIRTIRAGALELARAGRTTLEEVARVCPDP